MVGARLTSTTWSTAARFPDIDSALRIVARAFGHRFSVIHLLKGVTSQIARKESPELRLQHGSLWIQG